MLVSCRSVCLAVMSIQFAGGRFRCGLYECLLVDTTLVNNIKPMWRVALSTLIKSPINKLVCIVFACAFIFIVNMYTHIYISSWSVDDSIIIISTRLHHCLHRLYGINLYFAVLECVCCFLVDHVYVLAITLNALASHSSSFSFSSSVSLSVCVSYIPPENICSLPNGALVVVVGDVVRGWVDVVVDGLSSPSTSSLSSSSSSLRAVIVVVAYENFAVDLRALFSAWAGRIFPSRRYLVFWCELWRALVVFVCYLFGGGLVAYGKWTIAFRWICLFNFGRREGTLKALRLLSVAFLPAVWQR